jgi:hypothetical protein
MGVTAAVRVSVLVAVLQAAALAGLARAPDVDAAGQPTASTARSGSVWPRPSADLLAKLESIYKDLHANPELSMQGSANGAHCR